MPRVLMPALPIALLVVLSLSAVGCAPLQKRISEARLIESGAYTLIEDLNVPHVRGVEGCGAQALAGMIAHLDASVDATTLADELPWHDVGATPIDLLLAARQRGMTATLERGTWERLGVMIDADQPALVMFDVGVEVRTLTRRYDLPPVMHWGIVSGRANDDSAVLIASTDAHHHVVDRDFFLRRWAKSDYCLIVLEQ